MTADYAPLYYRLDVGKELFEKKSGLLLFVTHNYTRKSQILTMLHHLVYKIKHPGMTGAVSFGIFK